MSFLTIFISIFFLAGFFILAIGIRSYLSGHESMHWPSVPAEVTECRMVEDNDGESSTWKVVLHYKYSAAGHPYEGDKIAFGYEGSSARSQNEAIYSKLKPAKQVLVHYDPASPSRSVVAPGVNKSVYVILAFAITWLTFTTGFTYMMAGFSGADTKLLNQITVTGKCNPPPANIHEE